ncbi:hypothetical protein [Niastella populi]|uniref:N-acetyltransferase domain-containing protein n=1 Tax=Niastella populi TaxID=550983 RepID=A0A1V9G1Z0_9BACT|nr:hypothetical protein [Niastella populi]OQP64518.1 hypothetical protein A4R26_15815 [Niastella populi]
MTLYMDFLAERGYTASYLWTTSELPAAAALYRRYGFVVTEEIPSSSFGKPVIEQKYSLKL